MSRPWRLALGLGGALVAVNVLLALISQLAGGEPAGPPSSSYATSDGGAAAYAELLRKAGFRVRALREAPADEPPVADETVIVLDAVGVTSRDADALRRFVRAGGRLVVGGAPGRWLERVLPAGPAWSPAGATTARPLVPVPETRGVTTVAADGVGSWRRVGEALPVLAGSRGPLVTVSRVGSGRAILLADTSPLTNARLDEEDNAALGLGLAGPVSRQVAFAESFHGADASGLDALPARWIAALGLGLAACACLMIVRGRRFGPPEPDERELAPARVAYVEALGAVLSRNGDRVHAARALRLRVLERAPARDAEAVTAALGNDDANAEGDLLTAGRVLADVERRLRRVDERAP